MSDVLRPILGLAPVACFLAALVALDSYKLVRLRRIMALIAAGGGAAGLSYFVNAALLERLPLGFVAFSRYVSPVVEELLKGAIVAALIRTHRIGFLVDAAIAGFAVGTGFALLENLLYLRVANPPAGIWLVRGFGTAIMHGGAAAIFGVLVLSMTERRPALGALAFMPGFAIAVTLHSAFNHFFLSPLASTLGIAVVLPVLLNAVFARSESAMGRWLGTGFDAHNDLLELMRSGQLADSPTGRYLHELRSKFDGAVVADLLCYLRLHTELALRAKGLLMMRENGFDVPADDATREKLAEMAYLERSIGRTGLRALQPLLHMSHRDLWQLYMLGK